MEASMAFLWYGSVSIPVLLPGLNNLHSHGSLDRVQAVPVSNLRSAVLCLWFSSVLLHLLLWVYRPYKILLEDMDWTESRVAYIDSQRRCSGPWHCFENEEQGWFLQRRWTICLGAIKVLMHGNSVDLKKYWCTVSDSFHLKSNWIDTVK